MNSNLRLIVRGAYDLQKLRIQMGNRIVGNLKVQLGQEPGKPEEEMDAAGKMLLKQLRRDFNKITDGVTGGGIPSPRKFVAEGVIATYTELCLTAQYLDLEKSEDQHFRRLGNILKEYPIYEEFLEGVRGIGPAMAGVIISEIDITKARTASSLWKYAGLDVAADGRGRSRRAEHLQVVKYINKDGDEAERNGITFNPWLKTKLVGVLGGSFLKAGGHYADIYYGYRHRLECNPAWQTRTIKGKNGKEKVVDAKAHRHNAAIRYAVKQFLVDLYVAWRTIEGLPVRAPYHEEKLGLKHAA